MGNWEVLKGAKKKGIDREETAWLTKSGFGVHQYTFGIRMNRAVVPSLTPRGKRDVFPGPLILDRKVLWTHVETEGPPFTSANGKLTGGVNIIDLANITTPCCPLCTNQRIWEGFNRRLGFEILGRFDAICRILRGLVIPNGIINTRINLASIQKKVVWDPNKI